MRCEDKKGIQAEQDVRLGGPGEDQIQCVGAIKEGFLEEGAWLVPEQEMISPL